MSRKYQRVTNKAKWSAAEISEALSAIDSGRH